jgi:hypothetical protein
MLNYGKFPTIPNPGLCGKGKCSFKTLKCTQCSPDTIILCIIWGSFQLSSLGSLTWKPSVKLDNLLPRVNVFSFFSIPIALVSVLLKEPVTSNSGCIFPVYVSWENFCWGHKDVHHLFGGLPTWTIIFYALNGCWECSYVSVQPLLNQGNISSQCCETAHMNYVLLRTRIIGTHVMGT